MINFDNLSYNPETGVLTWVNPTSRKIKVGHVAVATNKAGYIRIGYNGKRYLAHRIAWFFVHGVWPKGDIDHINGIKTDNRISNLRDVSRSMNMENQSKPRSNNKGDFLGVSWHKATKKWKAQITINGSTKYLGLFIDPTLAYQAYLTVKRDLHAGCTI